MTIRNLEFRTGPNHIEAPERVKQRGRRVVRHKGGRLVSGSTVPICLAAFITLAGESLESLTIQGYAASDSNVQVDSPMHLDWVMGWWPWDFTTNVSGAGITTSILDSLVGKMVSPPGTGEPNPSGEDPTSANQVYGSWEAMWSRESLMYSKILAQSETATVIQANSHPADRFTETFKKKMFWETTGMIVLGVEMPDVSAQTDFGVAEPDTGQDAFAWRKLLTTVGSLQFAGLSAQSKKAYELTYGGDTFIEADTWKSDAIRAYALTQAVFKTPHPEQGKEFEGRR